jgi:putative ABC transport system permease protein
MTGTILGVKTFRESFSGQRNKIEALLNIGAKPKKILLPFVNQAIETALLPTLNSMLGMGIIALPGMMTGQILSGTLPTTAILYQIAIMIAITTAVCLAVFGSLYFGYRSIYNDRNQIVLNRNDQ